MSNELESQIKESLFKEKIEKFYKKNRIKIILIFIILIIAPIFFQINAYLKKKDDQILLEQYLMADSLIKKDTKKGLHILESLKLSKNQTIAILSINRLVEYYLSIGQKDKALSQIKTNNSPKSKIFKELNNIKEVIFKFDTIEEDEILILLNNSSLENNFKSIKQKLLYDFYKKNNLNMKAEQIKKNE